MTPEKIDSNLQNSPMAVIQELINRDYIKPTLSYHFYELKNDRLISDMIIAPMVPANDIGDLNEFIRTLPVSMSYQTLPHQPEATYSEKLQGFTLPLLVYSDDPVRAKTMITPNARIPENLIRKATSHYMIDGQVPCFVKLHVHPNIETASIAAQEMYNNLRLFNSPQQTQYEFEIYPQELVAASSLNLDTHERTKLDTILPKRMWPTAIPKP